MEVRILGPLEILDGDRPIVVRRPRERAVLTMLAAHPAGSVSADRLIDGLWGEAIPASAAKTLQTYVHHLRQLLPLGAIETVPAGYRLAANGDEVDFIRFQRLIDEGRSAQDVDPAGAVDRLRRALELWRGPPAADAPNAVWLRPFVSRLEDERVQAVTLALSLELDLGRHLSVLAEIRALLAEQPLREDLWRLYMLALYRAGRQAEALGAYNEARGRLSEELGIEPSPQLQDLEERILMQDPTLLVSPPPEPAGALEEPLPVEQSIVAGRRLVTFLHALPLGLEALRSVVDETTRRRISEEMVATMRQTVQDRGGSVIDQSGDAVVAVFGAPVALEDDIYRAIRCGLDLVATVEDVGREIEKAWAVTGVSVSVSLRTLDVEVTPTDEGDGFRVQPPEFSGAGRAGAVTADEHTRELMGDLFEWDRLEDGPWQVGGVRSTAGKARFGSRFQTPLVGRSEELAEARQVLDALANGVGGLLVISGEAGVGKTRLLEELRRSAGPELIWLAGHCVAYGELTPYWPFRDLIRSWAEIGLDDTDLQARIALRKLLEHQPVADPGLLYPYLGGLLGITLEPDQADRLRLAPEALQYRTFEVVETLLASVADDQPVVLALEDVHWADATSMLLLERLISRIEDKALLVVLTTRRTPEHRSRELIESMGRKYPHRLTGIVLGLLGEEEQRSLVASLVGDGALPVPVVDRIVGLAEGNPFYLEELIGSLIDRGALVPGEAGWEWRSVDLIVPETVEKVVQARIDDLPAPSRELVRAASVLGRQFSLPLLQGVLGENGAPLAALQELLRLDLLVETRRWPHAEFHFRHALIQEAAANTIPHSRGAELHRRAAEWLERRYEHNRDEVMSQLAAHWSAAGDEVKAIEALIRAGDLARRDHALDEAIDHYRHLLPILERRNDTETMMLVLFRLALALHNALRFREANEVYQRAFALWSPGPSRPADVTLRFGGPPFFSPPDPVRSYMLPDMQLQMALFDRLLERWPDDTLVPSLAESWEISDDGLRYRFHLREGLEWSDGHSLTADDVVFGVSRNLDRERPGVGLAMFYVIEGALDHMHGEDTAIGVEAVDERTVEFRLVNPAPYFLAMLNRPDCGPQPRHAIEEHGDRWVEVDREVVSGAFRRECDTKESTVLVRRPDYQGSRKGNVERVKWTHGTTAEISDRYLGGEIDLAWMSGVAEGRSDGIPPGELRFGPRAGLTYLAFVFGFGVSLDRRVRRALAHTVDRDRIAGYLPEESIAATGGIVPPALAGHTPDIAPRFDPDLARQFLDGVDPATPVRVPCPQREGLKLTDEIREVFAGWVEHLPLALELVEFDWPEYLHRLGHPGDLNLLVATWYPGYTDPEYYLRLLLHSEASSNYGGYASADYDAVIAEACAATDERTRLELFHRAERLVVADEAAVIPLSYECNVFLQRPGVEGWWEFGKSWASFADLNFRA